MDTASLLAELHAAKPLIGPSLLACDFAHLAREISALEQAGTRLLHLDIMDGHFVPNLSFGLPIVEAVRRVTALPLDVHLMISEPARYVAQFREAGADLITIHAEAVAEPVPLLRRIRGLGALAGISVNPPTPVSVLEACAGECDLVLVMSVMPGFGGQAFRADVLDKFRWLRSKFGPGVLLSVDGGVNGETIALCAAAGADVFVVGTGLFRYPDYGQRLAELRAVAQSARGVRA
jgi:ribulose-phosphate 3-epimerase